MAQGIGLEFKPQYHKKKEKKNMTTVCETLGWSRIDAKRR
jgi:hypothetical protein